MEQFYSQASGVIGVFVVSLLLILNIFHTLF